MSVANTVSASIWQRWLRQPKRLWFRKALFQIHLWCGISLGLYVFFISITGSVLVYRNELYVIFTPEPVFSTATEPLLSKEQLTTAAQSVHPGYQVVRIIRPSNSDQAVEIWLERGYRERERLFDPRTGKDLGSAGTSGVRLVTALIELHKEFLAGPSGRAVNGLGACAVLVLVLTGLVLWWPGVQRWRRSLGLHRGVGSKRLIWDLHSMIGIWSAGFILVFALSGIYLCFPEAIHIIADKLEPMTNENAGQRLLDTLLYWLAFLHFGRINGIGLPCSGPGLCDQSVKAVWALFGLAPALMFASGATMWWNRVLRRRWLRRPESSSK